MFAIRCKKWENVFIPLKEHRKSKSYFRRGVHFLFKKNLLITNSITSGAFIAIGDLVQQEYEVQAKVLHKRYDWMRTVRMFLIGTILGPLHHWYYIKLDKLLPKTDLSTVAMKILSDQVIAAPLTYVVFFYGLGVMERKTVQESTDEIVKKFKYVFLGDCLFWPPVQFINFYYLPTQYRVVYINLATMIFNIYLSYMKHYDQH